MNLGILIAAVVIALSCIVIFFQWKRTAQVTLASSLESLKAAISETVLKHTMESRQSIADHLNSQAQNAQARLNEQLLAVRKDLRDEIALSRQEQNKSFMQIEARVDKRLEQMTRTVQERLDKNMSEGFKHFEKVQLHLKNAEAQLMQLGVVGNSIVELNNLLKLPHLRGGFGETTLELLLDNFFPRGNYELQYQLTPDSREKVDAVLRMNQLWLPIDSKFPRESVLPLFENATEEKLIEARQVLTETIKSMAKDISDKYIKPEFGTTDMAFMFLPSETIYFEVIRNAKCWEYCIGLKVFPVSPNTLAMTLHAMKKSVEFQDLARGVEKTIQQVSIARRHFERFNKKFDEVGKGLTRAQEAFMLAHNHLGRYSGSVTRLTGEEVAAEGEETPLLESHPENTEPGLP